MIVTTAVTHDFWGVAVPAWVAAVGTVAAAIFAAYAVIKSVQTGGGLDQVTAGLNRVGSSEWISEGRPTPSTEETAAVWDIERTGRAGYELVNTSDRPLMLDRFEDSMGGRIVSMEGLPKLIPPGMRLPFDPRHYLGGPSVVATTILWRDPTTNTPPQWHTFYI
ncbi:hypothetical protein [Microbacterium sp. zg.Y909]|uniref:hypothetical protein n=1 Tax=Microbacterium sp. zg.Y909 TaxID=2969413 RepID=UPI00214B723D|nr:hypothetical protein [Microbacterium sp. zg.Y909]MCR2824213.1 hypothetical protein [Microbacterium sp. zg.Y909]